MLLNVGEPYEQFTVSWSGNMVKKEARVRWTALYCQQSESRFSNKVPDTNDEILMIEL